MDISEHNKELYKEEFKNQKLYHHAQSDKVKKIINLIRNHPEKVLDAGCGDGWLGKKIKDKFNAEVHGIDIVKDALKSAEKSGLKVKKYDLSKGKWPYKDNYFDLVVAGDILEHIYDTETFVRECWRILKKGGQLIVSTPNINSYQNRILVFFGCMPLWVDYAPNLRSYDNYKVSGHVRVFNKKTLIKLLTHYKFKIEKVKGSYYLIDKSLLPEKYKWLVPVANWFEKFMARITPVASSIIVSAVK